MNRRYLYKLSVTLLALGGSLALTAGSASAEPGKNTPTDSSDAAAAGQRVDQIDETSEGDGQPAEKSSSADEDAVSEVPGTTRGRRGAADYEELEQLENLEEENLQPMLAGLSPKWSPELLAPYRGLMSDIQRDTGLVAELYQGHRKVPVGAELLTIPAVRKRFEQTEVLGLQVHDHPSVRAYLDFFDGRGKKILAKWLSRMGVYEPLLREELKKAGLPQDLVYVSMIESGFSPYAHSPASAVGLWQFIPTTGVEMGLRIDRWVDERRDPVKATRAAIKYLTYLKEKFGSWPLALAAYNGGPGLVANTIEKYNTNNYWFIQRRKGLYSETRRYVPKVVAAGLVSKNSDIFGLDSVEKEKALSFEVVEVPPRTRLSLISEAAGVGLDDVEDLNPELLRGQTPPGDEPYPVRIPADRLERFVSKFDDVIVSEGLEHRRHRVRFGETVRQIAEQYEIPPRVIRAANGLEKNGRVPYGTELILPEKAFGSWKPRKKGKKKVIVLPEKTTAMKLDGRKRYFYQVNEGDTLEALGRGFGVNPADIVLWNNLDARARLPEDMILQLYIPEEADVSELALMPTTAVNAVALGSTEHKRMKRKKRRSRRFYHRVRSGESLWLIARKYRVTVKDLKRWNRRLRRSNLLQPGDKIVVHRGRR